jgi:hypothetical protein
MVWFREVDPHLFRRRDNRFGLRFPGKLVPNGQGQAAYEMKTMLCLLGG